MLPMNDAAPWMAQAQSAAATLNARTYDVEYPDVSLAGLVPINTDFPEWANNYVSAIVDKTGRAAWQSTFAKDVPLADVSVNWDTGSFYEFAVGYQFNNGELGAAGAIGFPITARKAEAARYAADLFQYEVALIGSAEKGVGGLINHTGVTPVAAAANGTASPTTAWILANGTGNKTPEEIIADVNAAIMGPVQSIGVVASLLGDTVLMPDAALTYIATTPYGISAPGKSILQVLLETNVYTVQTGRPLTVRALPALATAATVGVAGGGRLVAYANNANVLELPVAMPFRFFPTWQDGPFNFTVPGLGRIGALDLKRPALRYVDGITPVP